MSSLCSVFWASLVMSPMRALLLVYRYHPSDWVTTILMGWFPCLPVVEYFEYHSW